MSYTVLEVDGFLEITENGATISEHDVTVTAQFSRYHGVMEIEEITLNLETYNRDTKEIVKSILDLSTEKTPYLKALYKKLSELVFDSKTLRDAFANEYEIVCG